MIAYIIGRNRVEIGKIRMRDMDKHMYVSRKQLYSMYPDTLTRVIRYRYGRRIDDEEAIVYNENATCPYHPRNGEFDPILTMARIDEHKMTLTSLQKPVTLLAKYRNLQRDLVPVLPALIVVVLLAWSFIA